MADEERDPQVAEGYRALAKPEPPARLDDAILAASRRAVRAGPRASPLRRWTVPVSLAAAVVLTVMVTLRVQDEGPELVAPVAVAPEAKPAPAPAEKAAAEPAAAKPPLPPDANVGSRVADAAKKPAAPAEARKQVAKLPESMREAPRYEPKLPAFVPDPASAPADRRADAPAAAGPAPSAAPPAPAPAAAPPVAAVPKPAAKAAMGAAARSAAPPQGELRDQAAAPASAELARRTEEAATPERQLERIAELRRDGRHAEADKLLAEFRQRYPQYRIPEAMLEKVQPPR